MRTLAGVARGRFEGSPAQTFLRQLSALDFVDSIMLFGAALLISVLPFVILMSSLANHRIAFFWWTMYFLLAGRVSWRRLMRPAVLTALLWIGLVLFSSVYFSSSVISDSGLYGPIGVVFSLMIWFVAIGAVIVLGAAAGATWVSVKAVPETATPDRRAAAALVNRKWF